jgi:AcrR family transcriptional regulator
LTDKKEAIYKAGKALFSSNGFKNTNVSDITKAAGMATGTFYNYYPSKDKLFMEIYMEENVALKKSIMDAVDPEGDPMDVVKVMMVLNLKGINTNPILREWYNRDVFNRIEQIYREESGIDNFHFLYDSYIDIVKKWQAEGKMRSDIDREMIMAIYSALINIDTHKEEIGLQYFPQLMEHMADFVMKGLTEGSQKD